MFDVAAMGELLIDFTPAGVSKAGQQLFEQNPGGAPANVLTAITKLGKAGAFIGMVGDDQFGIFLREVLQKNKIDTTGLKTSKEVPTTLAFVHLGSDGDRSFSFYRNPGADMMIGEKDLSSVIIKNCRIFHFGSISLTEGPSRNATYAAVKIAKAAGSLISYDPNYRPLLWPSEREAVEVMKTGLEGVDIVKVSEEELKLLTGTNDLEKGSAKLYEIGISVIMVTLGPEGSFYRYSGGTGGITGFNVKTVDTTGAGDAFMGGSLYWFSKMNLEEIRKLSQSDFEKIIRFSNAMGALTTTRRGAIPAIPGFNEVNDYLGTL
jgi:fructokinase